MSARPDYVSWAFDALAKYGLDPTAGHVLAALARYAGRDGWAWPGRDTLMADTGRKRVAIDDALTRLRAAGVVEHRPAAPGRPARYRLTMTSRSDPADATSPPVTSDRNVTGPPVASASNVTGTRPERDRNVTGPPVVEQRTENKEQRTAAAARADELADHVIERLNGVGPINRSKLAAVIAEHPAKDHDQAVADVKRIAKREPIRSIVALYRHVLTDLPDTPPPPPEPDPPTDETRAAWATARDRLRADDKVSADTWDSYLADLKLAGQHDNGELVLTAPAHVVAFIPRSCNGALGRALNGHPYRIEAADDDLDDLGPEQPLDPAPDALKAAQCRCDVPLLAADDGEPRCTRCGHSRDVWHVAVVA